LRNLVTVLVVLLLVVGSVFGYLPGKSFAAEEGHSVSGIISKDTTWDDQDQPYIVTGNILVDEGVTLTIKEGVEVQSQGTYYLMVKGTLAVQGNAENKVSIQLGSYIELQSDNNEISHANFTSTSLLIKGNSNIVTDSLISSGTSSYGGITIMYGGNNHIKNTVIEDIYSGASVSIQGSQGNKIESSVIRQNYSRNSSGIDLSGSNANQITRTVITGHSGAGVRVNGANNTITQTRILNNKYGVFLSNGSPNTITKSLIRDNYEAGIYEPSTSDTITENVFLNNGKNIKASWGSGAIIAPDNYWGSATESEINDTIYDYYDDFNLMKVNYSPFHTDNQFLKDSDRDVIPPVITGVQNYGAYKEAVTIIFDKGTAVLNDQPISSGHVVEKEGDYQLVVTDAFGVEQVVSFVIDRTPPEIAYQVSTTKPAWSVTLTAQFSDNVGISRVRIPDGKWLTGITGFYSDYTQNGSYTFVVEDRAGNSTTKTVEINNIDQVAPLLYVNPIGDSTTAITGNTDAHAKVIARILNDEIGSSVADENGSFSIPIQKQRVGTMINVHAEDEAGNHSQYKVVTVVDNTPPVVSGVENNKSYNYDVTINYSDALATLNGKSIENGTRVSDEGYYVLRATDHAGNVTTVVFTIDKSAPVVNGVIDQGYYNQDVTITFAEGTATLNGEPFTSGTVVKEEGDYSLEVIDEAGNWTNLSFSIDKTVPTTPKVDPVTDTSLEVTGEAEPLTVVEVISNGSVLGNYTPWLDGRFNINIPVQEAGTELLVKATDKAGNVSEVVSVIVKDTKAPASPSVNPVLEKDTNVTGEAEPGSVVEVKVNGSVIGSNAAEENGQYSVEIPAQKPGTALVITATDQGGNTSEPVTIYVQDATAPLKPEVGTVTDHDTLVTGVAEPDSDILVKVNGVKIGSGTAGQDGKFAIEIPVQQAGTKLAITATDKAGNESEITIIVVEDTTIPEKPIVKVVTNHDTAVTGEAEPGSTVEVSINGKVVGTDTTGTDGKFSVDISAQKVGTVISIIVIDQAKNRSETTTVVVSALHSGWVLEGGIWYYYDLSTGEKKTGWFNDGGTWYYFNSNGQMQKGWLQEGSTWYFLTSSGAMKTGWLQSGSTWYYFNKGGAMATGWLQDGGMWYYFKSSGAMQTGWLQDGGMWYYFKSSGAMQTGWLLDGSTWYYFGSSGTMRTGWLQTGGQWYYFKSSGAMQTGWAYISGKWYYFDGNGVLR
jgi:hypothetical protein